MQVFTHVLSSIILIGVFAAGSELPAMEALGADEHIVFIGDGCLDDALKLMLGDSKIVLAKRGAKIKVATERRPDLSKLAKQVDKLLKRDPPTRVLFVGGLDQVWDQRKGSVIEPGIDALAGQVQAQLQRLVDAGAKLAITTPIACGADRKGEAHPGRGTSDAWAESLRSITTALDAALIDVHELSDKPEMLGRNGDELSTDATLALSGRLATRLGIAAKVRLPALAADSRVLILQPQKLRYLNVDLPAKYKEQHDPDLNIIIIDALFPKFADDFSRTVNQQPAAIVMMVSYLDTAESLASWFPAYAKECDALGIPCFLMTPMPANDDAAGPWDPNSAAGQRTTAAAAKARELAAQQAWPVLDVHAAAVEAHRADPTLHFIGDQHGPMSEAARQIMLTTLSEFLGVTP